MTPDARKAGILIILWTAGYATLWLVTAVAPHPLPSLASLLALLWPFISTGMVLGPTKWAAVVSLIPFGIMLAVALFASSSGQTSQ